MENTTLDYDFCTANICWSSGCLEDVFKTCLEDVFNTSSAYQFFVFRDVFKTSYKDILKTSWKRLEDVFKTSWKTKNCYAEGVLKKSSKHVLKTSWRHVLKTSSRRHGDKKNGNICISQIKCVCIWQVYISQIYIWRIQDEPKIIN